MGHLGNSCKKVKEKNWNGKLKRKREQKLMDDRQERRIKRSFRKCMHLKDILEKRKWER